MARSKERDKETGNRPRRHGREQVDKAGSKGTRHGARSHGLEQGNMARSKKRQVRD